MSVTSPYIGPEPGLGPDLGTVTGPVLLSQLGFLPAAQLDTFLRSHPQVTAQLLTNPPAAHEVSAWWAARSADFRTAFVGAAPAIAGNLNGLPTADRDVANRLLLADTVAGLESVAGSDAGRSVVNDAERRIQMLEAVEAALVPVDGVPRMLLSLDVTGQGRAAVVVGDLATADYVSYLVPGMFFTIEGQLVDWAGIAAQVQRDGTAWLDRLGKPGSVATVAWIGYDTPNLTNIGSIDNAVLGGQALAQTIDGLMAQRADDPPYTSVIAHSYGATAALSALADTDLEVDALAMLGSPGSPAQSVAELNVPDGNVWVAEAAWDPVPNSAFFGSDPGAQSYGANVLPVDGGIDGFTGQTLTESIGHLGYFAPDSESMRDLALIAVDSAELIDR